MTRHPHLLIFWMALPLCALSLMSGGCGDAPPEAEPEAPTAQPETPRPAVPMPPVEQMLAHPPRVWMNLAETSERAHLWRGGPVFDPGGVGWATASALGNRTAWLPVRTAGERTVAYPDGIGASLRFSVDERGAGLSKLHLWMKPKGPKQRVSLFIDEIPLGTLSLSNNGKVYTVDLPEGGLAPGEHHLRFYFRFTRFLGKKRTPGSVDQVRLTPGGEPLTLPEAWRGPLEVGGLEGDVLYAGAPTRWAFYLHPPPGARLFTKAAVQSGEATEFIIRIEEDGAEPVEPFKETVEPGTFKEVEVDLAPWANRPIRLWLETRGEIADVPVAGWGEPAILVPGAADYQPPTVENVIIWSVDGLRADRVDLGRGGERAATPNLDLLAAEGAASVGVWTEGVSPEDGHAALIAPTGMGEGLLTLPEAAAEVGRQTAYIGTSQGMPKSLLKAFQGKFDLRAEGDNAETPMVLRELNAWLDTRRTGRFMLYVTSDDPRAPYTPAPGFVRLYKQMRKGAEEQEDIDQARHEGAIAYDAQLTTADYWIGQMMALLEAHNLRGDTAVIIVGSVGQAMRGPEAQGDGYALRPELLHVPLVLWHPGLKARAARPLLWGGRMADVAGLALTLMGQDVPPDWQVRPLAGPLLDGQPLVQRRMSARLGPLSAARIGHWFLKGSGPHGLSIWRLDRDPELAEDLAETHPIALRFLRDSLLESQ
ncbi:MAG: sulfatase-like hydrolase/transferase [Bradymonadia bacterium]